MSDTDTDPARVERNDHTLYKLEARRSAAYQAQPVRDINPPETAPARRQTQPTAGAKRFCTVNQVMHSSTAQGCR